jgi:hypothetical protein
MIYEKLKNEVPAEIQASFKKIETLEKQLATARLRLTETEQQCQRIGTHINNLKQQAFESLTGSKNSFEKYQTSIRNNAQKLEVRQETAQTLENEIIPKLETDIGLEKTNLSIRLNNYLRKCRIDTDKTLNDKIIECMDIIEDFTDSFRQLFAEYGLSLVFNDDSLVPGPWTGEELRVLQYRLKQYQDKQTPPEPAPNVQMPKTVLIPSYEQLTGQSIDSTPQDACSVPSGEQTPLDSIHDTHEQTLPEIEPESTYTDDSDEFSESID